MAMLELEVDRMDLEGICLEREGMEPEGVDLEGICLEREEM